MFNPDCSEDITVRVTTGLPPECGGAVVFDIEDGRRWLLIEPLPEMEITPTSANFESWKAWVRRTLARGHMATASLLADRFDLDHATALWAFQIYAVELVARRSPELQVPAPA